MVPSDIVHAYVPDSLQHHDSILKLLSDQHYVYLLVSGKELRGSNSAHCIGCSCCCPAAAGAN